jgi:hypothetical protein
MSRATSDRVSHRSRAGLLRVMRDQTQEDRRRDEMAKAAAPYVHARLAAAQIEHTDKPSEPEPRTLEELRVALLAKMEEFGLSPFDLTTPIGVANRRNENRVAPDRSTSVKGPGLHQP